MSCGIILSLSAQGCNAMGSGDPFLYLSSHIICRYSRGRMIWLLMPDLSTIHAFNVQRSFNVQVDVNAYLTRMCACRKSRCISLVRTAKTIISSAKHQNAIQ